MNKVLLSTLILGCAFSPVVQIGAQSFTAATETASAENGASPNQGWSRVQALAPNTALHIKARTHNAHCRLQSADADTLTCLAGAKAETYQRTDIQSIKVPHRTRSTVVGLAAGAGVGAIIGAAAAGGSTNFDLFSRGEIAAVFAVPFAIIGAIVGALTDFTSSTIYRG